MENRIHKMNDPPNRWGSDLPLLHNFINFKIKNNNISKVLRKNINRGFKNLRVWNNAIELYVKTCELLTNFPFELKKTAGNCIDCAHSISRNIAEGYSRKGIKEYLYFLNIALGSSGEYHSSIISFYYAKQLSKEDYDRLDQLHYKTENELIQLIKALQHKKRNGDWEDTF